MNYMKIASIDIGSYSVRLSVAEVDNRNLKIILDTGNITSLGSRVKDTGILQKERIEETLNVLKNYKKKLDELKAEKVIVVATEALRKAKNSQEFIKLVKEEIGFNVKVISPEDEGKYAYLGAVYSLKLEGKNCVIDQGGGSTEYIYGRNLEVDKVISLPIGIVNLTETFLKHDPPKENEIKELLNFLEKEISKVKESADNLIGLGGTITTLCALEYNVYPYDPSKVHGKKLSYKQIKKWFDTLKEIPSSERSKRFKQIEDKRAEVILSGIAVFLKTLEVFGKEEITVSDWGLREGVIVGELLNPSRK